VYKPTLWVGRCPLDPPDIPQYRKRTVVLFGSTTAGRQPGFSGYKSACVLPQVTTCELAAEHSATLPSLRLDRDYPQIRVAQILPDVRAAAPPRRLAGG
jgi:hypothetical protein